VNSSELPAPPCCHCAGPLLGCGGEPARPPGIRQPGNLLPEELDSRLWLVLSVTVDSSP
jgi:hypothetical protein